MNELKELAAKLLNEGQVNVVIGWQETRRGLAPALITKADEASKLVFDKRSVHNLVTYLSGKRPQIKSLGKPAVIVKGCDLNTVSALIRESQLSREEVILIGVRCPGVSGDPSKSEGIADKCLGCKVQSPDQVDYLIGDLVEPIPGVPKLLEQIAELDAMSPSEKWEFWEEAFSKCIRCYACRQACPLCYCERCIADKTDPPWIEQSPHPRGNLAWNYIRALHLAGRCVGCGECERACPADIPLMLLNKKMAQVVEERFGFKANPNPDQPAPLGAFLKTDEEEFIR